MSPVATTPAKKAQPTLQTKRRPWRGVLETTVFLAAGIALLEWFLPIAGVGQEEFLQPDTKLGCRHIPGKYVVWRMEGFSRGHLNSIGLRDVAHSVAKTPGTTRIALLGDSSTEGLQVPLADTYARLVEQQLNQGDKKYEVINFACSSYSTGQQQQQFLNEVAAYKPDITVLLYNRGDAVENIRKPGKLNVEPRPYFYLDQQGALQQDNTILSVNKAKLSPNPTLDFLRAHSSIYGVLSSTNLALSTNEPIYGKIKNAFDWLSNLGNRATKDVTNVIYPEQDAFRVTRSLISDLHQKCKDNNSQFVLMVFPNTLGDLDLAFQAKQLLAQSKEESFPAIDLTQSFYDTGNPGSLFLEFHFSSPGHKVVADQLTKLLSSLQ